MGLVFARPDFLRNQEFLSISIPLYFGKENKPEQQTSFWWEPTYFHYQVVNLSSRGHCCSTKQRNLADAVFIDTYVTWHKGGVVFFFFL